MAAPLLRDVPEERRLTLQWRDVSAWVPLVAGANSDVDTGRKTLDAEGEDGKPPKDKQILFGINGTARPGTLLALMGPSGSGKSSLLSVLGGRSTARVAGSILINGQPLTKSVKRKMGFVTQDDLLFAELTTFETLYFTALLRLPSTWSREQKLDRVEAVLQGLGLSKCKDTIIGNGIRRGVSGGERKRVSIACELLINPSVICLDEPTSGLDSTTALKLVNTLRSLALGGRAILASIHQPSSRLFMQFDKLLLLADGHTLFYGDALASAMWLEAQGAGVPFGVSIPDHVLDLACNTCGEGVLSGLIQAFQNRQQGLGDDGIQPTDFSAAELQAFNEHHQHEQHLQRLAPGKDGSAGPLPSVPGAYRNGVVSSSSSSHGSGQTGHEATSAEVHVEIGAVQLQLAGKQAGGLHIDGATAAKLPGSGHEEELEQAEESKWGATWSEQVVILTRRCIRVRRFEALSIQRFTELVVTAVLAGLFWFQVGGHRLLTQRNVTDVSGLLFFQILFMAFSSMFSALFTFPGDFEMLKKERMSGMYRLSAYYVARSISDVPMDMAVPTLFCIIIYWMAGLRIAAGSFICNWLSMLLIVITAQSQGLLIGATIMNARTAIAFCTVYMLCVMLVAGFYVASMPTWIAWAKYLSYIWYGFNLMLKIEFSGRGYNCDDFYRANPSAPPGQTWCPIAQGNIFPTDVDAPVTLEVCVLVGFFLLIRVGIYQALRWKTAFRTPS